MGNVDSTAVTTTGQVRQADALTASLERELQRGKAQSTALRPRLQELLHALVEAELTRSEPLTEQQLSQASSISGPWRELRLRHAVDSLVSLGLVRRERLVLRATVAGIAASGDAPRRTNTGTFTDTLRTLRRAEIGTI